jgi:Tfp pilus assembly protein PilF
VPRKLIGGLVTRMASQPEDDEEGVQAEAQKYLELHPELEGLVPLLLDRSDGPGRELALRLAGLLRTPSMLEAARNFALGQRGPDRLRVQAAALADQARLLPEGPLPLWLEGAWRNGSHHRFEVHTDPVERTYAPGVFELLAEGVAALREGDGARAESALRRAWAIDPDDPTVMNNLALACAQQGRSDESEALTVRVHQRHPDYLFGRTALAGLAAERGDLDRARQLLEPLLGRPRLHVTEFAALCMAELNLHLAEGNRAQAEHWLKMWRETVPQHPSLRLFESRVARLPAR